MRVIVVDDEPLAREGLVALLDPDFPVDPGFAEREMVGFHSVDRRGTDFVRRLQRLQAR